MLAGALPNILYCIYLLSKNKSGSRFSREGTGSMGSCSRHGYFFGFQHDALWSLCRKTWRPRPNSWLAGYSCRSLLSCQPARNRKTGEWKNTGKTARANSIWSPVGFLVAAVFVLALTSRWCERIILRSVNEGLDNSFGRIPSSTAAAECSKENSSAAAAVFAAIRGNGFPVATRVFLPQFAASGVRPA